MSEIIFDLETLSQDKVNGVIVNLAVLEFDATRFQTNPYTFSELISLVETIKFDIAEQRKNGRTVDADTIAWWKTLPKEVQSQLLPSPADVSLLDLPGWLERFSWKDANRVWTRGNSFDPIFLEHALGRTDLYPFWKLRDTRTFLDAFLYDSPFNDRFIPNDLDISLELHNPAHDVALDVMRLQTVLKGTQ